MLVKHNTIQTFNTEHNYLRSIHFTGLHSQIFHAYFFTIDNKGNFIVSDLKAGCLKVFNPSGEYVETLGEGFLLRPKDVALDNQQRIVVISESRYSYLQLINLFCISYFVPKYLLCFISNVFQT